MDAVGFIVVSGKGAYRCWQFNFFSWLKGTDAAVFIKGYTFSGIEAPERRVDCYSLPGPQCNAFSVRRFRRTGRQ